MLSVIVLTGYGSNAASPEAVVRTLAALVPSVVEGLVRDVTLAAPVGAPQIRDIADHAGCTLAESGSGAALSAGFAAARGDLILVLLAGRAPGAGFSGEVADRFEVAASRAPRSAILRAEPDKFHRRLLPALAPVEGLIVRRPDLLPKAETFTAALRGLVTPVSLTTRLRRVG